VPFSGNGWPATFTFPDRPSPPPGQETQVLFGAVTPEYFQTLGIPLRQGRTFDGGDRLDTPLVIVVGETLARTYWPGQSALGKAVRWVEDGALATVVGVVGDVRHWRLDEAPMLQAYMPFAQRPITFATVAARTSLEPLALAEPVRQAIWRADPEQPMWKVRSLQSLVERDLQSRRFLVTLVGGFAMLALVLTWLGLYGLLRYLVDRRTPEIGIRMALGARSADVVRLLSRQGMRLVAVGLALGLCGAWLATGLLEQLLFGVSATDLPTFLAVAVLLLPITWLACYLPARRATTTDPMLALRQE
jgi:predicted permease